MWSYSDVNMALTKAYAACACGENLATAVRGPRSTPTVIRTMRSSLLSPVTAKATSGCSAARLARAARHLRVAPRRGRSWTWTTTLSGSAGLACPSNASAPVALCSMLIAPCHVLQEEICPTPSATKPTTLAVSYAVLTDFFGRSCPCRSRGAPRSRHVVSVCQFCRPVGRAHLSGGRLRSHRIQSLGGHVLGGLLDGGVLVGDALGGRGGRRERGERAQAVG